MFLACGSYLQRRIKCGVPKRDLVLGVVVEQHLWGPAQVGRRALFFSQSTKSCKGEILACKKVEYLMKRNEKK